MISVLAIDTETTGICSAKAPLDAPGQARIVQLAAILQVDRWEVSTINLTINPEIEIPDVAQKVHGISTEFAAAFGLPTEAALRILHPMIALADVVVAHNIGFDLLQLRCELARLGMSDATIGKRMVCTMEASRHVVNLPPTDKMVAARRREPKSPNLSECSRYFFGREHVGAHDALADVRMCLAVYNELDRIGRLPPAIPIPDHLVR